MAAKQETAKAMKTRHVDALYRAWSEWADDDRTAYDSAEHSYKVVRAVVYATTPGRQKARNIVSQLDKAVTAACRVIRRG